MKLGPALKTLTSAVLIASLLGCASIIDGGPKNVSVRSQPPGAKVTVFNKKGVEIATQQTPAIFSLKRAGAYSTARYRIVIEKPGYKTAEVTVKSTINGWYFGNFVFGGLLGLLIVDPLTGAMWTLSPKEVDQVLETQPAAQVIREQGGLLVMLRENVPAELTGAMRPLTEPPPISSR